MPRFLSLCFSILLVLAAVCDSRPSKTRIVKFKENRNQIAKWKCSEPKPRLIYLEDVYDEYDANMKYTPNAAVLYRCDKSVGCCKSADRECSVAESDQIKFTFQVKNLFDEREPNLHLTLTNHTSCECRSRNQSQKLRRSVDI